MRPIRVIICLILFASLSPIIPLRAAHAQSNAVPFSLSGAIGGSCMYLILARIDNSAGKTVVGSVSISTGTLDFFIMTQAELNQFGSGAARYCTQFLPTQTELSAYQIASSYSVNFVVPDNGIYNFVLFNTNTVNAVGDIILISGSTTPLNFSWLNCGVSLQFTKPGHHIHYIRHVHP